MSSQRFFTVIEFTYSRTAADKKIKNGIPEALMPIAAWTLAGLERTRWYLDKPMLLSSGYRCEKLNTLVGGAKDSQHLKAEAADFISPDFGTPLQICEALGDPKIMRLLGIDQLIWEGEWVHISFTATPRYQVLRVMGGKFVEGLG